MSKKITDLNTDIRLVEAALQDKNAFSGIIDLFEKKLRRYIKRISSLSREDEDDLLQEIFIKIYINLNAYDKNLSLSSWVYRVAHNQVIDRFRKDDRQKRHGKQDFDDDIFIFQQDTSSDILREIYQREDREIIQKVFDCLSIKHREILYLRFREHYSYTEISDILQKKESNITSMLHRAKQAFKKKYYELKK